MWRVLLSALLLALVSSPASSFKQFLEGKEDGFEVFVLPGSYYNLSSFDTTLMFNNKGPREIPMLVTVFAMEGERLDLSPVFVAGNSTLTVNLAELLPRYVRGAQFSDSRLKVAHPSDLRREPGTAHFKEGSLEVAYRGKWLEVSAQIRLRHKSGRYLFDEQLFAPSTGSAQLAAAWWKPRNNSKFDLILTNISQAPVSVVVEVVGEDDGEFLEASLGPRETRILNLRAATTHGAVLLKHSSVPGSVLARGQIYDSDLNYSSVVDFGDPATAESSALRGTGLRLAAVAGELLDPVVALFNRGTEVASVVIGVPLSIGEEVISVTLDAILIQPGNSAVVSEQRLCLASDAMALGRGGISLVARAAGVSRTTIHAGLRELRESGSRSPEQEVADPGRRRIRRPGGGRKPLAERDETLLEDLNRMLDPVTRGDPMSPLRWTCKSTTKLAVELRTMGHRVSQATVWRLLDELGYSMQSNRKRREGSDHPDRNQQFEFINASAREFLERGWPVISVDTKKKELIGPFKIAGREWQKKGEPVQVNMHDFPDPGLGKVIPYGVYDIGRNEGWVSVGVSHDTAQFAVEAIRRWWRQMGLPAYPTAPEMLITADGGGSNGTRVRLWKLELQRLADELNLLLRVRHFPPGTSKWNKIEHRMFCHITENWRGRPLTSRLAVVELIAATRTSQGLALYAELDETAYQTGKAVSEEQMRSLVIERCDFHGEWNYSLSPRESSHRTV